MLNGGSNSTTSSSTVAEDNSVLSAWRLFRIAKDINAQPWEDIGLVHPKSLTEVSKDSTRQIVHGMVSLLLVRIVTLVKMRQYRRESATNRCVVSRPLDRKTTAPIATSISKRGSGARRGKSQSVMLQSSDGSIKSSVFHPLDDKSTFESRLNNPTLVDEELPKEITAEVLSELYKYVTVIALHYRSVRYHSLEHAYHVLISCSKLLNMLMDFASNDESPSSAKSKKEKSGLTSNPLNQLALLFSAMIHDVDHRGITNQQLVKEGDELAIMYNDQSVAEQRSISLAFAELMKKKPLENGQAPPGHEVDQMEYKHLCQVLFGEPASEEYRTFRRVVIDLVLSTDIASPERVQIVKSKYKEAFGHNSMSSPRPTRENRVSQVSSRPVIEAVQEEDAVDDDDEEKDEENGKNTPEFCPSDSFEEKGEDKPEQRRSLREEFINTRASMRADSLASCHRMDDDDDLGSGGSSSSALSAEDSFENMEIDTNDNMNVNVGSVRAGVNLPPKRNVYRRASAPDVGIKPQGQRLGIMRALNLTGSTITLFSASGEQIDEDLALKTSALMELLLKAADVSSILQGWDNYLKWSRRLFSEMMEACEANRGFDPQAGWFDNQITFFDSYGMLLAKQLMEVGIIGPKSGRFASNIQNLRRRWLVEGRGSTAEMLQAWEELKKTKQQAITTPALAE
jgi:hypothetical protein